MAARVGITTKTVGDVLVVLRRHRGEYDGDDDISYVFRMCVCVSYMFRMYFVCIRHVIRMKIVYVSDVFRRCFLYVSYTFRICIVFVPYTFRIRFVIWFVYAS